MVKQANPDAKKGEEGYTSAFEGGVLVTNNAGEVVGNVPYGSEAANAIIQGKNVYKSGDTFSAKMPTAYADFNDKGDIVIHAPKELMEMSAFKNNVLENSSIKKLSDAYKIDPHYQFPDPEDDSKTISLDDQIKELNEGLKKYSDAAQQLADVRDKMAKEDSDKGGEKYKSWTLDQVQIALTQPQNDSDRVRIPDFILMQNSSDILGTALQKLPSWDANTKSISKEDLLKTWWSLDTSDKDQLLARYGMLDMYLRYSDSRDPNSTEVPYSMQTPGFIDPEQAAIAYSLKATLDTNEASANTATGINRKVRDMVGSELYSAAAQFSAGILSFYSGITGLVSAPLGGDTTTIGQLAKFGAGKATELEASVDRMNDDFEIYNSAAAVTGTVMQTLGNLGAILYAEGKTGEILAPVNTKITDAAEALEYISQNEANIVKGAQFAMKAWPLAISSKIAAAASTLLTMGNGVVKFAGEVLTDAAVDNPQVMHAIMSSEDVSDRVKTAMMEEAAWNGIGLAAGLTMSRSLTKVANTKAGKALNAALAVFNAKVETKASDAVYKLRSAIAKMPVEEKLTQKAEEALEQGKVVKANKYQKLKMQMSLKNEVRDAKAVLANLPMKETDAVMDQIEKIRTLNAAYDLFAQGGKQTLNAMVASDAVLRASNKNATDALDKALKEQTRSGLVAAKSAKYGSSGLSEIGSQYVSLTQRMEIANRAIADSASSLHEQAIKAMPVYEKQMAELLEQMTPEYRAALDVYVNKARTYYADMTDWAISEGLFSEELIEGYRNNNLFKNNNYMRVMVEDDVHKIKMQRVDGLISEDHLLDIKHLSLPDKVQTFVDPEVTRYWYGLEVAKSYNAKNLAESALAATGASPTVIASNSEMKVAREVSANSTEVAKAADKHYRAFINDLNTNIDMKGAGKLSEERSEMIKASSKRKTVQRKIDNIYKQAAIGNMPSEQIEAVFKDNGVEIGSAYDDLMVTLGDGGSDAYNVWYRNANDNFKSWLREQRNTQLGYKIGEKRSSSKVTFDQFNNLANTEKGFKRAFDEQTIFTDKKLLSDKRVTAAAKNAVDNCDDIEELTEAKTRLASLEKESKEKLESWRKIKGEIKEQLRDSLENYVSSISREGQVISSSKAISDYGQGDPEAISRYLALREIKKPSNLESIRKSLDEKLRSALPKKATQEEVKAYTDSLNETIDSMIYSEYHNSRLALDTVGSKVIDKKEWAEEVKRLQKKIAGARDIENVIKVSDGNGGEQLVEVSPNLAFLYNYRPRRVVSTDILSRTNQLTSRLFRFGTTTFSSKSFFNQMMRDSGNAMLVGNAWRGVKESADNLVDVWGESIVQELKEFDPEHYERLARGLREAGTEVTTENLAKAEVSRIRTVGKELSPAGTETELYRMTGRSGGDVYEKMQTTTKNFADKIDDIFNGKRERYLRERVFMSNLNTALEQGYSYKQAQSIATNMMQNATTNFSRSLYMLDSIAENVPYIRASINGTTSFWRMFSLDPVGVTGRILGGMMLPHWYLLGQSLSDPMNAEIYANIPEYEKRDSLVYVIRGHKVSIPIPQELGPVIAPFRHFIEYLYGAQKNNFWDLLGNDLLGLSPVDLTGFSNVDMNLMTSDPTILDRLNRGTMRIISTLSPVPVKAAWIWATGTDPYTGKKLANTSWVYRDPETGEEIPMGYKQGRFAEATAEWLGRGNPTVASAVISSIFGTTGEDLLDTFTSIFQGVVPGGEDGQDPFSAIAMNLVVPQFENAVGVFAREEYDRQNSLWRQAIGALEDKKNAITESNEWKDINRSLSQATSEKAIAEFRAKRQNLIDGFNQDVANTVKRLQSEYGGVFDRYKMASVMQLLNFSTNTDFDQSNQYLRDLSSDVYYAGRGEAIRTMQELGIDGTSDYSIFGYLKKQPDGSIAIKYTQPTAILDMGNTIYSAENIELANLDNVLKKNEINRGAMFNGYYAMKSKAEQKQYKADWNKKVARAIAPYIQSVGVDEVLNNTNIIDRLDQVIFVDNPYKAKDFIKKLFGGGE